MDGELQAKTLGELHGDIEAALFAAQDVAPESREKSLVVTKLEEALMWCERGRARLEAAS